MIETMLSHVIEDAFEKQVGKGQHDTGKALHIGFHKHTDGGDQYHVVHMYLFAPDNYVYVAFQDEFIGPKGKRRVGKMEIACCHDSCWRSSIQDFLFKNRLELSTFAAFKRLTDWYDILTFSKDEMDFLRHLRNWKQSGKSDTVKFEVPNPFDKRGIWKD